MKRFYDKLIHNRFFPVLLIMLCTGYVVFFFNLFYLGRLPLFDLVQVSRYPMLDRETSFIDQADYVINLDPLKSDLEEINKELGSNKMSLYLESLNSGANISINKDLRIFPASLAKLPLAIVIMRKAEKGEIDLDEVAAIKNDDLDSRSGGLYQKGAGTQIKIKDLVSTLLIDSDDTAQHMLLRYVSVNDMQDLITKTGLEALADPQGQISAKEYTRFFRVLYTSSYIQRQNSEYLLKLLSQASFKDFLSQGLPDGSIFAHKYGEDVSNNIYSDSGIVYLRSRPYMLTVMLQGISRDQAVGIMKQVSQKAYDYFGVYKTDPLSLID